MAGALVAIEIQVPAAGGAGGDNNGNPEMLHECSLAARINQISHIETFRVSVPAALGATRDPRTF